MHIESIVVICKLIVFTFFAIPGSTIWKERQGQGDAAAFPYGELLVNLLFLFIHIDETKLQRQKSFCA